MWRRRLFLCIPRAQGAQLPQTSESLSGTCFTLCVVPGRPKPKMRMSSPSVTAPGALSSIRPDSFWSVVHLESGAKEKEVQVWTVRVLSLTPSLISSHSSPPNFSVVNGSHVFFQFQEARAGRNLFLQISQSIRFIFKALINVAWDLSSICPDTLL